MHPKSDLVALNQRRDFNRRLKFARRRMLETVIELAFARGTLSTLPRPMETPPEWALAAARLTSDRWLKPLLKLTPEIVREDPRSAMAEVLGMWDAMIAFLDSTMSEVPAKERSREEFKAARQIAHAMTAKRFRDHLEKIERALNCLLPKPTHEELITHAQSRERGLRQMFSPDGEVVGNKPLVCKAYYCVWFFWPRLVSLTQLRAQDLQRFLAEETGTQFSLKLCELVHTDVGLARRELSQKKPAT